MKKKLESKEVLLKNKFPKLMLHENETVDLAQQPLLRSYCSPRQIDKVASLHRAVRNGYLKTVKRLFEEGIDIEAKSPWGAAALYIAVSRKHFEVVKFLIENDADVNAKTSKNNDTPLNLALYFTDIRFAQLLIESGVDIEEKTLTGDRPLHVATKNCNIELANLLLIHGANIEARSPQGLTPLDIAIKTMDFEIAKMFVWYGAIITSQNIYDSIVEQPNMWELETQNMLKIASMLDRQLSTQIKDSQEFEFESLTQSGRDLLFNRVLFKSFRNKKLSLNEFNKIVENLLNSLYGICNMVTERDIDLLKNLEGALNELVGNIVGSSIKNEIGNVPSLFKLSFNTLVSNGLWDKKKNEAFLPDIVDKLNLLENIEHFTKKMHLMFQPEMLSIEEKNSHVHDHCLLSLTGNVITNDQGLA